MPKEPQDDAARKEKDAEKRRLDERLDEALEETFPASDVPAIQVSSAPARRSQGEGRAASPRD
jgi:hypothetical protein